MTQLELRAQQLLPLCKRIAAFRESGVSLAQHIYDVDALTILLADLGRHLANEPVQAAERIAAAVLAQPQETR